TESESCADVARRRKEALKLIDPSILKFDIEFYSSLFDSQVLILNSGGNAKAPAIAVGHWQAAVF
ncbi:hypothetical protein N9905_01400, partial [bacterium]|nr:hypothetical protein [bacterium]